MWTTSCSCLWREEKQWRDWNMALVNSVNSSPTLESALMYTTTPQQQQQQQLPQLVLSLLRWMERVTWSCTSSSLINTWIRPWSREVEAEESQENTQEDLRRSPRRSRDFCTTVTSAARGSKINTVSTSTWEHTLERSPSLVISVENVSDRKLILLNINKLMHLNKEQIFLPRHQWFKSQTSWENLDWTWFVIIIYLQPRIETKFFTTTSPPLPGMFMELWSSWEILKIVPMIGSNCHKIILEMWEKYLIVHYCFKDTVSLTWENHLWCQIVCANFS